MILAWGDSPEVPERGLQFTPAGTRGAFRSRARHPLKATGARAAPGELEIDCLEAGPGPGITEPPRRRGDPRASSGRARPGVGASLAVRIS